MITKISRAHSEPKDIIAPYWTSLAEKVADDFSKHNLARYYKHVGQEPFRMSCGIYAPFLPYLLPLLGEVTLREKTIRALVEIARELKTEYIFAVGIGGIPIGSLMAGMLRQPLVFARKEEKGYGINTLIEGQVERMDGKQGLLFDDNFSTARSAIKGLVALRKFNGVEIHHALGVLDTGLPISKTNLTNYGITPHILTTLPLVARQFYCSAKLTDEEFKDIESFYENPVEWGISKHLVDQSVEMSYRALLQPIK